MRNEIVKPQPTCQTDVLCLYYSAVKSNHIPFRLQTLINIISSSITLHRWKTQLHWTLILLSIEPRKPGFHNMTPLKPGQVFRFHSCYQMHAYRGQRHKLVPHPDKNRTILRQTLTPSVHSSSLQATSQFCQRRTGFKTRVIVVIMSLLYTGYGSAESEAPNKPGRLWWRDCRGFLNWRHCEGLEESGSSGLVELEKVFRASSAREKWRLHIRDTTVPPEGFKDKLDNLW